MRNVRQTINATIHGVLVTSISMLAPVYSMDNLQSSSFDFQSATKLAQAIEKRWKPTPKGKVVFVHVRYDPGKDRSVEIEKSSGDGVLDSQIESVVSSSLNELPSGERIDCYFGFGYENERVSSSSKYPSASIVQSVPKVWFVPPNHRSHSPSPSYPRYWSDGRPDLQPYKDYAQRALRHVWEPPTAVRDSAIVEVTLRRDLNSRDSVLIHSSGSKPFDAAAVRAGLEASFHDLPDPGPVQVHLTVRFGKNVEVRDFQARYQ